MQRITDDRFIDDINSNIGIIHKICNIYFMDSHDRQDAAQEILYQLWKSYAGFKGEAKFSTWMYKVALNTAITYAKKSKRKFEKEKLSGNENFMAEHREPKQPDETMAMLYGAINTLSGIDRAITLLYLEENSYDEIAAITGLTRGNVSVRLVRIKKSLKEKLAKIM
jgi:RNA polymerase sigma factor (sigma-70 family)